MALGSLLAGASGGAGVAIVISAVDNYSKTFANVNKKLLGMGTAAVIAGAVIVGALATTIAPASDLEESINAVTVAYGENAEAVLALGEDSAKSFGLSKAQFNSGAVAFSAFADIIAVDGETVAGVVEKMTMRTADFASVMNLDLGRAQTLMQAGLAGETEGLRRFGIDVSAATVKTFAYANGIGVVGTELTEQEKILARYGTIMEQTNKFQGDFANTSDDWANSTRILKASITDFKASLGKVLLPTLAKGVKIIQSVVDWFNNLSDTQKKWIVIGASVVAGLLLLIGTVMILIALKAAILGAIAAIGSALLFLVANPIGLAIMAIAALVLAGIWLVKNWDRVKQDARELGAVLQNVWISIQNAVISVWNFIVSFIEKKINDILDKFKPLIKAFNYITGSKVRTSVDFDRYKGSEKSYVNVPSTSSSSSGGGNTIYINNVNGLTGKDIADELQTELNTKIMLN